MAAPSDLLSALCVALETRTPKRIGGPAFRALPCGGGAQVRVPTAPQPRSFYTHERRAAVAVVLRRGPSDCGSGPPRIELLLIRRAVNARDPWSGDVALPGGKVEAGETDLEAAIRECKEEVLV